MLKSSSNCEQLKKVCLVALPAKTLKDDTILCESSGSDDASVGRKESSSRPAEKSNIKAKLKDTLVAQYQLHPRPTQKLWPRSP